MKRPSTVAASVSAPASSRSGLALAAASRRTSVRTRYPAAASPSTRPPATSRARALPAARGASPVAAVISASAPGPSVTAATTRSRSSSASSPRRLCGVSSGRSMGVVTVDSGTRRSGHHATVGQRASPPKAAPGSAVAKAVRTTFACAECGASTPRWVGRCPSCGAWNTLIEEVLARAGPPRARGPVTPAIPITEVAAQVGAHKPTGIDELDRVLGGGLVDGSVVLLAGEPGIGKSTLLLAVLAKLATEGRVLYVCAEESREQVRLRAERLDALHPDLYLAAETDLGTVRELIEGMVPRVVVVDSVQTIADPELAGAPGGVGQVREVAAQLVRLAKELGIATFLEGRRPLVTEVQALVVPSGLAIPRRMAQDLDQGRLAILIAVLERRARVSFGGHDVFAATAGGVRLTEPAADLAVCLALASAARDWHVPADLVAFGEVGLGGEVRPIPQLGRRLAEASRLGFRRALVPTADPAKAGGMAITPIASVSEALSAVAGGAALPRPRPAAAGRAP